MPKVAQHIVEARRARAAALLREHRYLGVGEVAKRLGVSENTARRDLAVLAERSQAQRTFGGAVAASDHLQDWNRRFASFAARLESAADAKRAVADRAAKLIESDMTVFVDAGSTGAFVAEALAAMSVRGVTVFTHSLAVAARLGRAEHVVVQVLGGRLLARQAALLDESTLEHASALRCDLAILGAEAFDASGAWNSINEVVDLQRRVIVASDTTAVCCDATKCSRRAPALLAGWDEIDLLVTDASAADLRRAGVPGGRERVLRPRSKRA
ncbi:MAG: DeoR/GlpR family DNA-binding transcription regulator [Planctomycetota bacterium]